MCLSEIKQYFPAKNTDIANNNDDRKKVYKQKDEKSLGIDVIRLLIPTGLPKKVR